MKNRKIKLDKILHDKIDKIKDSCHQILNESKENLEKTQKATQNFKENYQKFTSIAKKGFLSLVASGLIAQTVNVAYISYNSNDWNDLRNNVIEYYEPSFRDFKDKNIYNICERDMTLCLSSGGLVGYSSTKGIGLIALGASMMTKCFLSDGKCNTVNGFLESMEKSTGYIFTKQEKDDDISVSSLPIRIRENEDVKKEKMAMVLTMPGA